MYWSFRSPLEHLLFTGQVTVFEPNSTTVVSDRLRCIDSSGGFTACLPPDAGGTSAPCGDRLILYSADELGITLGITPVQVTEDANGRRGGGWSSRICSARTEFSFRQSGILLRLVGSAPC